MIATTPEPPYFAVIFSNQRTGGDQGYEAMAERLVELASNPERAAQAGRAGRELIEQRFSLDAMVGAYKGVYDRLLFDRVGNQR